MWTSLVKESNASSPANLSPFSGKKSAMLKSLGLGLALLFSASLALGAGFTPTRAGTAIDQPNGNKSIGEIEAGKPYQLLKVGGPAGGWCKLQLPQGPGWVLCNEGTQSDKEPSGTPVAENPRPSKPGKPQSKPGVSFDYYLLSLSWSPSFCEGRDASEPEQCGPGKDYGFVVHGLWPQGESGRNPMSCATPPRLSEDLIQKLLPMMPSHKLIAHEWEKHGTCSALSPEDYFAKARLAFDSIHIPKQLQNLKKPVSATLAQIEQMFIAENPGMTPDMIAVQCKRTISEVRFCLDKELKLRACGRGVGDSCRGTTLFPPLR